MASAECRTLQRAHIVLIFTEGVRKHFHAQTIYWIASALSFAIRLASARGSRNAFAAAAVHVCTPARISNSIELRRTFSAISCCFQSPTALHSDTFLREFKRVAILSLGRGKCHYKASISCSSRQTYSAPEHCPVSGGSGKDGRRGGERHFIRKPSRTW